MGCKFLARLQLERLCHWHTVPAATGVFDREFNVAAGEIFRQPHNNSVAYVHREVARR